MPPFQSKPFLLFPFLKSSGLQDLGSDAKLRLPTQAPARSSFLVNVALCGIPVGSVIGL